MTCYYNPKTGQTAKVNKADKDGKVWVEIDGGMPVKMNWREFLREFRTLGVSK
ncbi:hypothetical protein LU290_03355 [Moraxella nasibovis]|uniref:hypothetical protein n=1 Tax=Moraxella nasibovis TaxID=2904120 RepID=UPI00240FA0A2|nr:hypothetical protein [Moraxella nasibovis]WFF39273.1 hypothetical protein LU290_03355 [Moraxella nasibovis]